MANLQSRWDCPAQWSEWSDWLAAGLHARNRWRLPVLMTGMLFAGGRRTVTTWLRAGGVNDDCQDYYYFLGGVRRNSKSIATQLAILGPANDSAAPAAAVGHRRLADQAASVQESVEAFADRAAIEQDSHYVKEVRRTGQQQVRNIWNNLAAYKLNLWMHTMVELWARRRSSAQLVDRGDSPWDDPRQRPSHANRRKALRTQIMQNQLLAITANWSLPRRIMKLAQNLNCPSRLN